MQRTSIAMISAIVMLNGRTNSDIQYGKIHHLKWLVFHRGYTLATKNNPANILCMSGYRVREKAVRNNNAIDDDFQLFKENR
jgi:hypothetical protein